MTSLGTILIADDDPDFVAIYREMLAKLGLEIVVAATADAARASLQERGRDIDVVLLDQKLQGPGGPDTGLDLIEGARALAPFARVLVVTGYATPDAIERAFRLGVYDYLVKNGAFDALLRAKVRNAIELGSERRRAAIAAESINAVIRQTWDAARVEADRNAKGRLLEELVKLLFQATPGFDRVQTRLDNDREEIDIVVENRATEEPWTKDGAIYLLGECKNWSSKCGSREFRDFNAKLTTKYQRARTGFFFAPGGLTQEFHAARAEHARDSVLVIPVDAEGLERWIDETDRLAVLRALYHAAVFDTRR